MDSVDEWRSRSVANRCRNMSKPEHVHVNNVWSPASCELDACGNRFRVGYGPNRDLLLQVLLNVADTRGFRLASGVSGCESIPYQQNCDLETREGRSPDKSPHSSTESAV